MKVVEVKVHKLFNLGNYENMRIELHSTVEETDDVMAVYAQTYFMIEKLFKATQVINRMNELIDRHRASIKEAYSEISYKCKRIEEIKEELRDLDDVCTVRNLSPEEIELMKIQKKKRIKELRRSKCN